MARTVQVRVGEGLSPTHGPDAALRRLIARAVRAALRDRDVTGAEVSVALLGDAAIADMNQRFLQHDGPTDVISFALFDEGEEPVGDIYIGFEQAVRQAAAAGVDIQEELVRLAVHGTLHVLGYDHADGADRVHSDMWGVQERIVAGVLSR